MHIMKLRTPVTTTICMCYLMQVRPHSRKLKDVPRVSSTVERRSASQADFVKAAVATMHKDVQA
jgi:hypothetical protein